jgi:hypothetical protein
MFTDPVLTFCIRKMESRNQVHSLGPIHRIKIRVQRQSLDLRLLAASGYKTRGDGGWDRLVLGNPSFRNSGKGTASTLFLAEKIEIQGGIKMRVRTFSGKRTSLFTAPMF